MSSSKTPLLDMLPSIAGQVAPLEPNEAVLASSQFELCDSEEWIFSCWAAEHVRIAGVPFQLFHLDLKHSTRDPLYDEPIERVDRKSVV